MLKVLKNNKFIQYFLILSSILFLFYSLKGEMLNSYVVFNGDAAFYLSTGKLISQGLIPFNDYWDHKTPFIHYFSYLCYQLFDDSYFGGIYATTIAIICTFLMWLSMIIRENYKIAFLFLFLYYILIKTNNEWMFMGETFCFFLTSFSCFFLFNKKTPDFLSTFFGFFLLFFSFLVKQLIIFDSILVIIFFIYYFDFWKNELTKFLSLILIASSAAILINLTPLILTNSIESFTQCFLHNFGYSQNRLGFNLKSFNFSHSLPLFSTLAIISLCLFIARKSLKDVTISLLLLVWILGAWFMSNGTHQHYMITLWQPFIFSLFYFSKLIPEAKKSTLPRFAFLSILPLFLLAPILTAKFEEMKITPEVYTFIEKSSKPDDTYFMFSNHNGGTLMHLNRIPSCYYSYLAPIAHIGGDKYLSTIIESLESNPPDILIISELDSSIVDIENFKILHEYLTQMAEKEYIETRFIEAKLPLTDISLNLFLKKKD